MSEVIYFNCHISVLACVHNLQSIWCIAMDSYRPMHMYKCQNRAFPRICCGEPFSLLLEIHRKIDKEFIQVLHELHVHAAKCLLHFIPPTCSANWVTVKGTKYQMPCALVIGKGELEEDLQFAKVVSIYIDGGSVIFEVIPFVIHPFCHHHHVFPVSSPPLSSSCRYLIRQSDLLDYHPYGLYHSSTVSTDRTLEYVVLRSNVYA